MTSSLLHDKEEGNPKPAVAPPSGVPFGCRAGSSQTRPWAQTCEALFPPSSPPVGARGGNAGDQRPVPDSSSAGLGASEKPVPTRRAAHQQAEVRRGCLSPKGEFRAGRLLGAAQGGRRRVAGRLLCDFSWRQESRPGGGGTRSVLRTADANPAVEKSGQCNATERNALGLKSYLSKQKRFHA